MQTDIDYSDIRFYNDDDYEKVMRELAYEPEMRRVVRFLLDGNILDEEVPPYLLNFKDINDFQLNFIINVIKKIRKTSVKEFSYGGLENVDYSKPHLFLTNHRNIVLDAAFLNLALWENNEKDFQSTGIAIGDNLLTIPWVRDIARINKSFIVKRGLGVQQMLESSKKLSNYIRDLITKDNTSVWIASREGRTKDGNDFTQAGLLKMFQMSSQEKFVENFGELNILPVAISYEFDPCDSAKVKELVTIANEGKYEKGPLDDFNSMFNGLMGEKGRVHYQFGKEISLDELKSLDGDIPKNEKIKHLADYLDDFYHQNYKLRPSNYIAADLLNGNSVFAEHYTAEDSAYFVDMMQNRTKRIEGDVEQIKRTYLSMFAYPVKNRYKNDNQYHFDF
jgi:1-acyl-sn-glycerol-3-phosphate acyltransferase